MNYALVENNEITPLSCLPESVTVCGCKRYHPERMSEKGLNDANIYSYCIPEKPDYNPDLQWLTGPILEFKNNKVVAKWVVVDKTESEKQMELDKVKERKKYDISGMRFAEERIGIEITIGDNTYNIKTDRDSQSKITGAALKAMSDANYTCKWKTADCFVELNASQIIAMADLVRTHVQDCFNHENELDESIDAATTIEEVEAIQW